MRGKRRPGTPSTGSALFLCAMSRQQASTGSVRILAVRVGGTDNARTGTRPGDGRVRLISPLIFLLVGGIIQLGLAINYWMDMQRIANQGARWAAVARYPLPGGAFCTSSSASSLAPGHARLAGAEPRSDGLHLLPEQHQRCGDGRPVQVRLSADFSFIPKFGIGTLPWEPTLRCGSNNHRSTSTPNPPIAGAEDGPTPGPSERQGTIRVRAERRRLTHVIPRSCRHRS